jgi:hypothetical protein
MAAMTYLFRHPKTSVYYFRRAVPEELRDVIGRREWKKSLGTKDVREAKRLAHEAALECERALDQARNGVSLTDAEAAALANRWLSEALAEDADARVLGRYAKKTKAANVLADEDLTRLFLSEAREALAESDYSNARAPVAEMLEGAGLTVAEESESFKRAAHAVLRAQVKLLERVAERQRGVWRDQQEGQPAAPLPSITPSRAAKATGEPLSVILDKWLAERLPPAKTRSEWETTVRRFTEVVGDLPVDGITKADVRDFKDALVKLPRTLSGWLRTLPVPEVLRVVGGDPTVPRLSAGAVNKHLTAIRSLLSWAEKNGYCETNVARGLTVADPNANREKRLPYDADDLKLIFESPLYTEERDKARSRWLRSPTSFWLPLLAFFTGARLELDLNTLEEGKSLKTRSSRRKVPLHPELVRCGFLAYVADRREKGDRQLFPDLKQDARGSRTASWSKWWGRYARNIGITDRRKVFHSGRHMFKDAARAARIEEAISDALTGHSSGSVGRSYGTG